jgi:hypothetical protein
MIMQIAVLMASACHRLKKKKKNHDVLEMPAAGTVVMVYNRNCDRADHACMSTRAAS